MLTNRFAKLHRKQPKDGSALKAVAGSKLFAVRAFAQEADIIRLGRGLLDRSVALSEWTHEAHIAAVFWLIAARPDIDVEQELPHIIGSFNVALGGVNDDRQGYHETITQTFVAGVRAHLADIGSGMSLLAQTNGMLSSARGRRQWPLSFYSELRLFSVFARRYFVEPDLAAFNAVDEQLRCAPRVQPVAMDGG